jgi:hypothetical protein
MPVKRVRTTHGIFTREMVSLSTDENGEAPSIDDWKTVLACEASPAQWMAEIEQFARGVLTAAGLPERDGIKLRKAVADHPYTREWFAAEVLRHITFIRNDLANHSDPWHAIRDGVHLGNLLMMAEIKLGLEADVLLGRRDRKGRSIGGHETASGRRHDATIRDRKLLADLARIRQTVDTDAEAIEQLSTRRNRSTATIRRQLSRARQRNQA